MCFGAPGYAGQQAVRVRGEAQHSLKYRRPEPGLAGTDATALLPCYKDRRPTLRPRPARFISLLLNHCTHSLLMVG